MLYHLGMTNDPTQAALDALSELAPGSKALNDAVLEALEHLHRAHAADGDAIAIDDAGVMHGERVHYFPTVRTSKLATPGDEGERHIEGLVWHYTDTYNAGAVNLAHRIATKGDARSCHLWIDRPGVIAQSASFERGTWHAGSTTAALFRRNAGAGWEPISAAQRGKVPAVGANSWAAGIELENVGEVRLVDGRWLGWPFKMNGPERPAIVPASEVGSFGGKHWHLFTDEQEHAATRVVAACVARYGLLRSACEWTHQKIDPTRRTDPGPAWTTERLPRILEAVFGKG